jgi:hypothetical protein
MSHEWVGVCPASCVLQYGYIYLCKTMLVQEVTRGLPEFAATDEALAHILVNVHVDIASAETLFFIGEAILFVWHGAQ